MVDEDESDIEIDEESTIHINEKYQQCAAKYLINKLDLHAEIIIVKPNLPVRVCRTAIPYTNLRDVQIITVN